MATKQKAPVKKAASPVKTSKVLVGVDAARIGRKYPVRFVSFSFGAIIPTGAYGNIKPELVVEAQSYEEAAAFAIPKIEELYRKYAEFKPAFLGKVEVSEKVVAAPVAAQTPPPAPKPAEPTSAQVEDQKAQVEAPAAPNAGQKPESVMKAEKKLSLTMSEDAALAVQDQIEKSEKIPSEWKQYLLDLCIKKRNEFKPAR